VTLIDRRNFHLFQPLLYQVATGSLSPGEVAAPLRAVLRDHANVRCLMEEVVDVDPEARCVRLADGSAVLYDTLVAATGSNTSYFGHESWRALAGGLKSVEDATALRHRIFAAFEQAERIEDPAAQLPYLTFVIIGGGPTGVELAGALAEIARKTLRSDFRTIRPERAQIILLDGGPRILPAVSEFLSAKAERALLRMGVRVRSRSRVTEMDPGGVTFDSPQGPVRIETRTAIWAGGVEASAFGRRLAERLGVSLERNGKIAVSPNLTVPGHPDILVVGDLAAFVAAGGHSLPGVAQVAIQQGEHAARAIRARLAGRPAQPFRYFDLGDMAVIGRASAVGKVFGVEVWGWFAWLLWAAIHVMKLVEFQSRVVVLTRWAIQYVTFSRGARLITASGRPDEAG
jgi:NADH dehydrogenase